MQILVTLQQLRSFQYHCINSTGRSSGQFENWPAIFFCTIRELKYHRNWPWLILLWWQTFNNQSPLCFVRLFIFWNTCRYNLLGNVQKCKRWLTMSCCRTKMKNESVTMIQWSKSTHTQTFKPSLNFGSAFFSLEMIIHSLWRHRPYLWRLLSATPPETYLSSLSPVNLTLAVPYQLYHHPHPRHFPSSIIFQFLQHMFILRQSQLSHHEHKILIQPSHRVNQ